MGQTTTGPFGNGFGVFGTRHGISKCDRIQEQPSDALCERHRVTFFRAVGTGVGCLTPLSPLQRPRGKSPSSLSSESFGNAETHPRIRNAFGSCKKARYKGQKILQDPSAALRGGEGASSRPKPRAKPSKVPGITVNGVLYVQRAREGGWTWPRWCRLRRIGPAHEDSGSFDFGPDRRDLWSSHLTSA